MSDTNQVGTVNYYQNLLEKAESKIAHLEQQEEIHHSILDEWGVGRADDGGNVWSIIGRINELGSHKDGLEQQLSQSQYELGGMVNLMEFYKNWALENGYVDEDEPQGG